MNIRLKFKHLFTKKLFQLHCLLCASHNGGELGFCEACLQDLPWHIEPQCPQCSLLSNGLTCGSCLNALPHFDATQALFTYDFPVDSLLQHYKYRYMLHLANTFASLLIAKKLARHKQVKKIDLILPIPMHPSRLQARGFNQALELARIIAKNMQLQLDYSSCQLTKLTPSQASLPSKERIKNIKARLIARKI